MKSRILVLLVTSLSMASFAERALAECTGYEYRQGKCDEGGARSSSTASTGDEKNIFSGIGDKVSSWFSTTPKDAATREIGPTGQGELTYNPRFKKDESTKPARTVPTPNILNEEPVSVESMKKTLPSMTKTQLDLLEQHKATIVKAGEEQKEARESIKRMNSDLKKISEKLDPLDDNITAKAKKWSDCESEGKSNCGFSDDEVLRFRDSLESIRKERKPVVEEWNKSMNEYNDALRNFDSSNARIKASLDPYLTARGAIEREMFELQTSLQRLGTNADFSELNFQLIQIDDKLDAMESRYDRTLMGAYVQDKIGHLLTSDILCKAKKACAPDDKNNLELTPGMLDEIFPKRNEQQRSSHSKGRKGTK